MISIVTMELLSATPPRPGSEPLADDGRPLRLVIRHLTELMQASALRWMSALGCDRLDSLIVTVVLTANIAHVSIPDSGLTLPDDERRPISPMAIADSMRLPYETVRRRVKAMCAAGLLRAGADGVIVIAAATVPPILTVIAADAEALRATTATLATQGHDASARARLTASDAALTRAMLDLAMRMMQHFVTHYGGLIAGSVFTAIIAANVRHLLFDPVLARRYATASQVPPDSERRPVAIRTIARALNIPYETVRRQVAALAERGLLELGTRGAVVPSRIVASPEHDALNRFNLTQYERMLAELSRG